MGFHADRATEWGMGWEQLAKQDFEMRHRDENDEDDCND